MSATVINEPNPFKIHFQLMFRSVEHQQVAYSELMEEIKEHGLSERLRKKMELIEVRE